MEYRISELMENFEDDKITLDDAGVTIARRVEQMTRARLGLNTTSLHRGRKLGRVLCVAALFVMILTATAVAVYQYTVADLIMTVPESAAATPAASGEASQPSAEASGSFAQPFYAMTMDVANVGGKNLDLYYYSLAGYDKESPEYKAQQEWLYYFFGTEHDFSGQTKLPESDPHSLYVAVYDDSAKALDDIAAKYDLALANSVYRVNGSYYEGPDTTDGICDILGVEPFMLSGIDIHTGELYDEGSFEVNGDLSYPGGDETVFVKFYCAMDGTMPVFNQIYGEAMDTMEYKTVTTACGATADLALGYYHSMVFVNMGNCHVLVNVNSGSGPQLYGEPAITMADLEAIASCFDYTKVDKFDRAQRAATVAGLFAGQMEAWGWD